MAVEKILQENACGKDEVALDEHALKRMNERGITEAQVLATLRNPDMTGLRADPGRLRVRRHYGSHASIDVVYEEEPTRILVVSAIRIRRN
jgi:Domain of unknown function (DUF4258)